MVMKFRKKPIVVEAIQYTGKNYDEINKFSNSVFYNSSTNKMFVGTRNGSIEVKENDWVIKGVEGNFYPCKPDVFDATYERVD